MFRPYSMSASFSRPYPLTSPFPSPPQPGEIWQVRQSLHPLLQPIAPPLDAYSPLAQQFLQGNSSARYVMIVRELEPNNAEEDELQAFSVMVLSQEVEFLSDVDVLIPAHLSGIGSDLLVETWQVLPTLGCSLEQPVGTRLSRAIYDELMTVGDKALQRSNSEVVSQQSLVALGLTIAPPLSHQQPKIQAFHQQEDAWSDVLTLTYDAYQTYLKSLQWADVVLAKTLEVEQDLQALTVLPIARPAISLNNWFQQIFEKGWLSIAELTRTGMLHLAPSPSRQAKPRNSHNPLETDSAEIAELIHQLTISATEAQRRRIAKQLGTTAIGNTEAIQALTDLMRSTEDDETLWAAVESLWQIDPGNSVAGVRRVRLIDLGLQVAGQTVALAIAMIQRQDQRIGIMLRIYPIGDEPHVPENLKLILLDDTNRAYEVLARRNDLYIQLKFNGHPGESFSVQVCLGEASVAEDFII